MADYTLAVGTHDPYGFSAATQDDAIRQAVGLVEQRHGADLTSYAQEVVTLMGPDGLLTRPSERIDEFVNRVAGPHGAMDASRLQPGDANTPDCNGD